jgi:hypothetical protein
MLEICSRTCIAAQDDMHEMAGPASRPPNLAASLHHQRVIRVPVAGPRVPDRRLDRSWAMQVHLPRDSVCRKRHKADVLETRL